MEQLVQQARNYAVDRHRSTNHRYDSSGENHRYEVHLEMVFNVAQKHIGLIPKPDRHAVLAACWCHDLIEDCRETYNDVKDATSQDVAEIVYALTNEKGKNRKERANDKYYEGIRTTKYASFVKLCDRIANTTYSRRTGSRMYEMYRKENDNFVDKVAAEVNGVNPLIVELKDLFIG